MQALQRLLVLLAGAAKAEDATSDDRSVAARRRKLVKRLYPQVRREPLPASARSRQRSTMSTDRSRIEKSVATCSHGSSSLPDPHPASSAGWPAATKAPMIRAPDHRC